MPGKKPRRQRQMLIAKSIERPLFTATGIGGMKTAIKTKNQSRACILTKFNVG